MTIVAILAVITLALSDTVTAVDQLPTVTLGESNNEAQRSEVMTFLEVTRPDQVMNVTVADTVQAMEGVFDVSGIDSAYSSTAMTCGHAGSGISVSTWNIEAIPPELYALVMLTADMSDVQLVVAAPSDAPALGMTAMTGVLKTWQLAPCSDSGHDAGRRRLALEELALIAEIGGEPAAIRQITQVVLEVQQEIIKQPVAPETLETILESQFEARGVDVGADALTQLSGFLGRLSQAGIDWGPFAHGWTTQPADDGSAVVLMAKADESRLMRGDGTGGLSEMVVTSQAGVGVTTAPTDAASSPPAPTDVTESMPVTANSTPAVDDDAPSGVMGTVTEGNGSEWLRWWPLVALPLAIFLAWLLWRGLLRVVHQLGQRSLTRYVSRVAVSRSTHKIRQSMIARPSHRTRTLRVRRESL